MNRPQFAHRYTANHVLPFAPPMGHHGPGTCGSCGKPSGQCGCRECRKESKELVVRSSVAAGQDTKLNTVVAAAMQNPQSFTALHDGGGQKLGADITVDPVVDPVVASADKPIDTAFIGGGCCVHLSVEYAPVVPTAKSFVMIIVIDSEGTLLAWAKTEQPGVHYQVKENVITTKPGATVLVAVFNATARVRWCECFSC
jgi:hypothetical protein